MPTLELVLDATGMQRGAQAAEAALKIVQDASGKTVGTVQGVNRALNSTFQATQGGVQIATGIAQTAQALQSMNGAMAGFQGARMLLEIGQTAQQLAILRGTASTANVALLTLGRALPYLGLALSGASALYAIFGNSVGDTTKKIDEQTEAMDRLLKKARDLDRAAVYAQPGQKDPRQSQGSTVEALLALRGVPSGTPYYGREAASLFGVSEQDLRYALARSGLGESALELRYPPHLTGGAAPGTTLNPWQMSQFSAGQLVRAGESLLRDRQGQPTVTSQGNGAWEVQQATAMSRSWGAAERAEKEAIARKQDEVDKAHIAALERQVELATQIGGAFGAAAFDVLAAGQNLRQVLLSLFTSIGRQSFSNLGANLFNATARQVTGTTNPNGGDNLVLPP